MSLRKKIGRSKYHNIICAHDGMRFDSIKERTRWLELKIFQGAKEISLLQRQVPFPVIVNNILICKYYADFTYMKNGRLVIEDCKSVFTRKDPVYRLKKKLMKATLNLDITEVI